MIIGRQFTFDSSHFLKGHSKCGELHGHTWTLNVEVEGPIDEKTGMIVDYSILKRVVEENILSALDHKNINQVFLNEHAFISKGLNEPTELYMILAEFPTCENLCTWIANELSRVIPRPFTKLYITLQEGKGGYCKHELKLN